MTSKTFDRPVTVDNPQHYRISTGEVECIQVVRHMSFNLGNAVKYLWRLGNKDEEFKELKKALWYINDELELLNGKLPSLVSGINPQDWATLFERHILTLKGDARVMRTLINIRGAIYYKDESGLIKSKNILHHMVMAKESEDI